MGQVDIAKPDSMSLVCVVLCIIIRMFTWGILMAFILAILGGLFISSDWGSLQNPFQSLMESVDRVEVRSFMLWEPRTLA